MGGCRSSPEVEQEHLQALGPALGPIFHALHNEVLWLHAKWLEYRRLYGGSADRVKLLNSTAPFFFHVVQEVLWEDVLLHIARLTDRVEHGASQNLTLLRLPEMLPDPELAEDTTRLVKIAESRAGFARTWRNKRLAHCDLAHALEQAVTLPAISRRDVEGVLESFQDVMNRLHSAYLHSSTAYGHVSVGFGDADGLVYNLAEAQEVEAGRQQRAREHKSIPEDFQHPIVP